MGTEWGLRCKQCDSDTGAELNRGQMVLSDLARMSPLIKQIRQMDSTGYVEMSLLGGWYGNKVFIFDWLTEHAGHEMELLNEYGDIRPLEPPQQEVADE